MHPVNRPLTSGLRWESRFKSKSALSAVAPAECRSSRLRPAQSWGRPGGVVAIGVPRFWGSEKWGPLQLR